MKRTRLVAVGVMVLGLVALMQSSTAAQENKGVRVALQPVAARQPAPQFDLEDATGKIGRLSEYRGRVVLLDFWATSCGGCVQEIPAFIDIAKTYERRGLTTLGVSEDIVYESLKNADEAWARVRPFVRDHKVNYRILMGDSRVTTGYRILALPLTYLIDAKGRIAATYVGVVDRANLEANITTLLAEPR